MLSEELLKKVKFVQDLSKAITPVQTNVKEVRYEIYSNIDHPKWITEFLVVDYDGGAISVRNCTGNSYSAIFEELAKMLDHGYYSDLEYYSDIVAVNIKEA